MATVAELNVEIGARISSLDKGLKDANRKLDDFGKKVERSGKKAQKSFLGIDSSVAKLGKSMLGVFGAVEIVRGISNFAKESFLLGAELEGVRAAFDRINQPGLLANLQSATRGTVNNLELMRKAVQAKNFKIPLENLGSFFEFATNRAIETGESVDYLVDSIVTGIGRKSALVLDNLGISATELQEELSKTGDFAQAAANIINRELEKSGTVISTAKTRMEQLAAATDNFKLALGTLINQNGLVGNFFDDLRQRIEGVTGALNSVNQVTLDDRKQEAINLLEGAKSFDNFGAAKKADELRGRLRDILVEIKAAESEITARQFNLLDTFFGQQTDFVGKGVVPNIALFQKTIEELKKEQLTANRDRAEQIQKQIEGLENQIKEWQGIGESQKKANEALEERKKLLEDLYRQQQDLATASLKLIERNESFITRLIANNKIAFDFDPNDPSGGRFREDFFGSINGNVGADLANKQFEDRQRRLVEITNSVNAKIEVMNNKIQDAGVSAFDFTSAFQAGLTSIISLLIRGGGEAEKFGNVLSRVGLAFLSIVLSQVPGGNFLSGFLSSVPSFASGGIVRGPQLALVGDNPGRTEAVIPSELFPLFGGGGSQTFRIRGNDLNSASDRQRKADFRNFGR